MARYFPGGNTASGFCSRFGDVLPEPERKRMIYLKGGPGVGKSSLMKRAAERWEAAGERVDFFHCSSDPGSLDAIAVPERGFAVMDGTAPHVQDPVLPMARDELINLADLLDADALKSRAGDIARLTGDIGRFFRRAYDYLAAAADVRRAACRAAFKPQAVEPLLGELCEGLPLRGGWGRSRELFAEAYTPQGFVSLLEAPETVISLEAPFGQTADPFLRALANRLQSRGLSVTRLLDPLEPEKLAHLSVPAHGILITTARLPGVAKLIPADRLFDVPEGIEREQGFDRNAFELLTLRASEQIRQAKQLHDELESFYTSAMDFSRWEALLQRACP